MTVNLENEKVNHSTESLLASQWGAPDFQTKTSGKWILAGEHAVLRGSPALVFPIATKELKLNYWKKSDRKLTSTKKPLEGEISSSISNSFVSNSNSFNLQFQNNQQADLTLRLHGPHGPELEILILGVLEKACQMLHHSRSEITGTLEIYNTLPVGAGMGASAALCVAVAKFLEFLGFVQKENLYEFSRELENIFHGESSGVDIAVALYNEPLIFERSGRKERFQPAWKPVWTISYSGQRGVTKECVEQVKALIEKNPTFGARIDQEMRVSVEMAYKALLMTPEEGEKLLIQSINQAAQCFLKWGLCEGAVEKHMHKLLQAGALAVKPTGSGGGGYVLALWSEKPSDDIAELISC